MHADLMTLCDAALLVEKEAAAMEKVRDDETPKQSMEIDDNKELFLTRITESLKAISSNNHCGSSINTINKHYQRSNWERIPKSCKLSKRNGSESEALPKIRDAVRDVRKILETNALPTEIYFSAVFDFYMASHALRQRGFNTSQLTVQDQTEKVESEVDILKFGEFEHDYAKSKDEPSRNCAVKQKKKQRRKFPAHDKWCLDFWNSRDSIMPSHIPTAPFPFVHHPESLEPAAVVEFYPNCEPVDVIQPAYVPKFEPLETIFKKKLEKRASKRKSESAVNASRSVLECVDNLVTCKPSASSEQKDVHLPQKGIENSANIELIAKRNIQLLEQQRNKRRCREKPSVYICEICDKAFTANTSLHYHYLAHLNIKPFQCMVCSRRFTRRHSLNYHMMIHDDINRFMCSICEKQFRHPSHFKEHLRKHTGEEPYSCQFCTNNFKTRNSYKRHLKMQHQKLLTSNGIVPICKDIKQ